MTIIMIKERKIVDSPFVVGPWYDAKINVGCLLLRSEINYGNIRLRMTLK